MHSHGKKVKQGTKKIKNPKINKRRPTFILDSRVDLNS